MPAYPFDQERTWRLNNCNREDVLYLLSANAQ